MPLGPFKVEYLLPDQEIPQRSGFKKKAKLVNYPKMHMIPVAGVSFRQQEIRQAIRIYKVIQGRYERRAELVYENTNKYDPQAVAVYFMGEHVGYLPKGLCKEYRNALSHVIPKDVSDLPLFCPAILVGGGLGEHIGFRLALPKSRSMAIARSRKAKVGKRTTAVSYDPKMFEKA